MGNNQTLVIVGTWAALVIFSNLLLNPSFRSLCQSSFQVDIFFWVNSVILDSTKYKWGCGLRRTKWGCGRTNWGCGVLSGDAAQQSKSAAQLSVGCGVVKSLVSRTAVRLPLGLNPTQRPFSVQPRSLPAQQQEFTTATAGVYHRSSRSLPAQQQELTRSAAGVYQRSSRSIPAQQQEYTSAAAGVYQHSSRGLPAQQQEFTSAAAVVYQFTSRSLSEAQLNLLWEYKNRFFCNEDRNSIIKR